MIPKEGRLAAASLVTRKDYIDSLNVRLAQDFTGTADADFTLADLTDCDFDGYAQISNPAWGSIAINGGGQAEGLSPLLTWTAGALFVPPQTIKAVYIEFDMHYAGAKLFWFKKLSPTVTLGAIGEQFQRYIDMFTDDDATFD